MPRCEEPIEDFLVSCTTNETSGGTVQNPEWDVMNGTELYVRANEINVTMFLNISNGMPIYFNLTRNGTLEKEMNRKSGSGKIIKIFSI